MARRLSSTAFLVAALSCAAPGSAVLGGCVPKGRLVQAEEERVLLQKRIEAQNATLREQSDGLHAADAERAALRLELEETRRSLVATSAQAGELQQNVAMMEEALRELERRKARAEEAIAAYRELVGRFRALIDAGTLRVTVVEGRMVVELATDILFAPGSATLSGPGRKALGEVAAVLASIEDREYQIAGHTDDDPIRTDRFPNNWHLGAARAISVVELLVAKGLPPHRLSVSSYGENRPTDTNRTREGKAANRRIEIVVVPDLSVLPGFDELNALAERPPEGPPPGPPQPPPEALPPAEEAPQTEPRPAPEPNPAPEPPPPEPGAEG